MLIVDASPLVAIVRRESDGPLFERTLETGEAHRISAANFLEAAIVIDGSRDPSASRRFDELCSRLTIAPVTEEQVRIAREAYRDFGRGSGHRAQLNCGDCFAYALAKVTGEPLLYKGDDFGHTDVRSAVG